MSPSLISDNANCEYIGINIVKKIVQILIRLREDLENNVESQ